MNEQIKAIMEASPPVLLAIVLNVFRYLLKKSPVSNWVIPWALVLGGGVIFPFICDKQTVVYNAEYPWVYTFILGCCVGGLSVALYEGVSGFLGRNPVPKPEMPDSASK